MNSQLHAFTIRRERLDIRFVSPGVAYRVVQAHCLISQSNVQR
jgi:hypothetical protein